MSHYHVHRQYYLFFGCYRYRKVYVIFVYSKIKQRETHYFLSFLLFPPWLWYKICSIVKNFCFENIYSNVSTNNGTNMNRQYYSELGYARILLLKSKKKFFSWVPKYAIDKSIGYIVWWCKVVKGNTSKLFTDPCQLWQ